VTNTSICCVTERLDSSFMPLRPSSFWIATPTSPNTTGCDCQPSRVHSPRGQDTFQPKTTLDSLYTSILQMAFSEEDPEVDSKVRSTIGTVVLLVNPLPPSGIAELIGLDPEEVILFLTLVQSLLTLDEDFNQPVKPFHKSFPDFITDPSRCTDTRFYISPGNLHLELAMNCLRVMNDGFGTEPSIAP
jgi:hypothetical protein